MRWLSYGKLIAIMFIERERKEMQGYLCLPEVTLNRNTEIKKFEQKHGNQEGGKNNEENLDDDFGQFVVNVGVDCDQSGADSRVQVE